MADDTITDMFIKRGTNEQCQREPKINIFANLEEEKNPGYGCYDQLRTQNEGKLISAIREWEKSIGFETPVRWFDAIAVIAAHVVVLALTGYFLCMGFYPKWQTLVFSFLMTQLAGFGVTGGVHRYWCHRSYKAKMPLQIILIICFSIAGQNNVFEWVRDHRVHHKFSDTSADPHNIKRGFFFSHVGWLMMKKRPDVLHEGRKIDMSDITRDPLVSFHTKYFTAFKLVFCFIIPIMIPKVCWGECWTAAVLSQAFRYLLTNNFTWSVNSFAHLWGAKPYNRHIMPSENRGVSIVAMGEGWHNYHHTFPWDYKTAELGTPYNLTTNILDMFARIGWAYDLKVAPPTLVDSVVRNRGHKIHEKSSQ